MKFKIKPDIAMAGATILLGVAQTLLSNKKEADNKAALKNELKDDILKELSKEKN